MWHCATKSCHIRPFWIVLCSLFLSMPVTVFRFPYLSALQPGMVTTDLLMSGANTKQVRLIVHFFYKFLTRKFKHVNILQAKFFINVLAEPAEVVRFCSFTRSGTNSILILAIMYFEITFVSIHWSSIQNYPFNHPRYNMLYSSKVNFLKTFLVHDRNYC